jgi:hypothetical protein
MSGYYRDQQKEAEMARDSMHCNCGILTAIVLSTAAGCTGNIAVYNLSSTSVFGPYCGKDVTLTREVVLVETALPGVKHPAGDRPSLEAIVKSDGLTDTFPYAYMVYPNQLDAVLEDRRISARAMLPMSEHDRPVPMPRTCKLPVGTKVHVLYTFLEHDTNLFTPDHTYLNTMVRVEGLAGGWPPVITAMFNNGDGSVYDGLGAVREYDLSGHFWGKLQPAPWERTEPSATSRAVDPSEWWDCRNYVGRVRGAW